MMQSAAAPDLSNATIGQLLIPVSDLDRAVAFYRDTLGLRLLFTAPPQMSFFQAGDVRLLIGVPEGDGAGSRSAMIYLKVADIRAVAATLESRGVSFMHAPHVVHDQSVSAAIVSPCTFLSMPCALTRPTRSCTTFRGDNGLPTSNAGQLSSHRPHETHASSSTI